MKLPTLGMTIIGWPEEFEHRGKTARLGPEGF
jgi:hypothetical protein